MIKLVIVEPTAHLVTFPRENNAGHGEAAVAVDSGVLADSPQVPVIDLPPKGQ